MVGVEHELTIRAQRFSILGERSHNVTGDLPRHVAQCRRLQANPRMAGPIEAVCKFGVLFQEMLRRDAFRFS